MSMIILEDLTKNLNKYDSQIYESVKKQISYDSVKSECILSLF